MHIEIKKGLDIPIVGKPKGDVDSLPKPNQISLNLEPFDKVKFRLLAKAGEVVKIGQPIAEDKGTEGRLFVSPAAGVIKEVRRGLKRRLLDIVIDVAEDEETLSHTPPDVKTATPDELISFLKTGGLFAHIRSRPFNLLADPHKIPKSIFVKAVETAPFVPPAEMQVKGNDDAFQLGLTALNKLTSGSVHLVYHKDTDCVPFINALDVEKHTVKGPHPVSNHSLHIERIDPINGPEETIWTLNAHDVVCIGHFLKTGNYFTDRIISVAGPGAIPSQTGYFKARAGYPISQLISGRIGKGLFRFISGDPLMGKKVETEDFLHFNHFAFTIIAENTHREFMHFFRLGGKKYTFSRAYLSGHRDNRFREYEFTTNQHGEHRPFIDPTLYDQIQPLQVPTMQLVKAVMAEDYDLAEELGLLDVISEDFALTTFVCPSKMEMTEIIKQGQEDYAVEVLG